MRHDISDDAATLLAVEGVQHSWPSPQRSSFIKMHRVDLPLSDRLFEIDDRPNGVKKNHREEIVRHGTDRTASAWPFGPFAVDAVLIYCRTSYAQCAQGAQHISLMIVRAIALLSQLCRGMGQNYIS